MPERPYAPAEPSLRFVFEVRAELGPPLEQGEIDGLRRRIIPVLGGTVEGPRLRGRVLPGGADWQTIRPEGTAEIYARYTLEAEDGTLIGVENPGLRRGPTEVIQRLAAGERVEPSAYYFRTTPRFMVRSGPHRWLAESVFVCQGVRWPDSVEIRFHEVL